MLNKEQTTQLKSEALTKRTGGFPLPPSVHQTSLQLFRHLGHRPEQNEEEEIYSVGR